VPRFLWERSPILLEPTFAQLGKPLANLPQLSGPDVAPRAAGNGVVSHGQIHGGRSAAARARCPTGKWRRHAPGGTHHRAGPSDPAGGFRPADAAVERAKGAGAAPAWRRGERREGDAAAAGALDHSASAWLPPSPAKHTWPRSNCSGTRMCDSQGSTCLRPSACARGQDAQPSVARKTRFAARRTRRCSNREFVWHS
jgi:hypothetical protein